MKTRPCLTERLLMGRKESNQTNKQNLPLYNAIYMYTSMCYCLKPCFKQAIALLKMHTIYIIYMLHDGRKRDVSQQNIF